MDFTPSPALQGVMTLPVSESAVPIMAKLGIKSFAHTPGGGGPERMGPRPPPWVPLLKKSYNGSNILSTSLGSKILNTSLGLGGTKIKDQPVGIFHLTARCLQAWRNCPPPPPGSTSPIMAKLGLSPVLRVLFWCNLFDVSSVFWLLFQANLILINHLHRPSLAKSECAERW